MQALIKKLNIGLWGFLGLAVCLSCFGLLRELLPEGHDLIFHLSRIESLAKGLELGEFPVRIYPDYFNGYGYANGVMYPDLFLYPASLLCLAGLKVTQAYKILILVYTFLTAIFMYRTLIKITAHEWAARLGMLLYTVSLYRMVDVWTRAALGEIIAFMFIPFILLGIYHLFFDDERQWYDLTIGFSGLFLSHLLSGLMWTIVLAGICVFKTRDLIRNPKRLWNLVKATMMSVLLVSYYLFPMIEQLLSQKFRVSNDANYELNWLFSIREVFFTYWISGNPDDWFPGGVGISVIGLILFALLVKGKESIHRRQNIAWISLTISIITLVMMCRFFPWHIVVKYAIFLGRLQFPWRLLMVATAFLTLAFSLFFSRAKSYQRLIGIVIVVHSVLLGVLAECETLQYYEKILEDPLARTEVMTNSVTDRRYTVGNGEYIPIETDAELMLEEENRYAMNQNLNYVTHQEGTTITIDFSGSMPSNLDFEVPLLYYKGYQAKWVTGSSEVSLQVVSGTNGSVRVIAPKIIGEGRVIISYEGTTLQKVTEIVSLISLIGFMIIVARFYLNNKKGSI